MGKGEGPGQKRVPIKNGAPVVKGTARGPQRSGAHKKDGGGCRAMALMMLGGFLVISSVVAYGALELAKGLV